MQSSYEPNASTLLEIALNALKDGEYEASMSASTARSKPGSFQGRQALAFWYIHLTAEAIEREDDLFEALSSFAVVAHELLVYARTLKMSGSPNNSTSLDASRWPALLAARWAQAKTAGYGLSLSNRSMSVMTRRERLLRGVGRWMPSRSSQSKQHGGRERWCRR